MTIKREMLAVLRRESLKAIVDRLDVDNVDRRSARSMRKALSRSRRATPAMLAEYLHEQDAKAVCEGLGLPSKGRRKQLIGRLLDHANGNKATRHERSQAAAKRRDGAVMAKKRTAESYEHSDSKSLMRPDVGTQAQFKKKKPPVNYRYDSSLSPSLQWDGQNPAREEGEQLIARLLEASAELETVRTRLEAATSPEEAAGLGNELSQLQKVIRDSADGLKRLGQPFLDWAGKAERLSFDVPTLPLFVHERLSTKAIIETLSGHRKEANSPQKLLFDLFADPQHPIADQVLKAYEYQNNWVNRLILGDSLVVMNSLVHYENLGGQVQMVYMDPPYGVQFGSNFQPFVRRREVKHNDDEHMTREPEMVQAYRDTWELGLHSYLTYMRDRLLLARDLLHPTGSCFVQISTENLHRVCELMDEVFGAENRVEIISFRKKTMPLGGRLLEGICDYIVWYAKNKEVVKYRQLFEPSRTEGDSHWNYAIGKGQSPRKMTDKEINNHSLLSEGMDIGQLIALYPTGSFRTGIYEFEFEGKKYNPPPGRSWKTPIEGMRRLAEGGRLVPYAGGGTLRYLLRHSDYPVSPLSNVWADTSAPTNMQYVVETNTKVVARCVLMATDPGDLVFDPTCGSGTTAYVAEQWGRRWITADTSRVPLALARQRLLTATFPWYELKDETHGPGSGFAYRRKQNKRGEEVGGIVPHITLKSIANDEPPKEEVLVDRPQTVNKITRVTGPFCVEAMIPTPVDWEGDGVEDSGAGAAESHASFEERMLEVLRKSPVLRLEGNRKLTLYNVRQPAKSLSLSAEAMVDATAAGPGARRGSPDPAAGGDRRSPAAEGDLRSAEVARSETGHNVASRQPVAFLFGPENGAISEKLVFEAAREAYAKSYTHLYVIGFAVQPKARESIDKCDKVVGIAATYVQATPDLMMGDLLKNMRSSQIFSVCGLPEIMIHRDGAPSRGKSSKKKREDRYQVEVIGLDVFDPATMDLDTRAGNDVPAWFLDTDYNDLCFHVCQAFFPRTHAWDNIRKALKGTHDESVWDHLAGTKSAPFEAGENRKVAVKVIDDRGNELLVVKSLDEVSE